MTDPATETPKPKLRVVYLGTCTLEGNKPGELWAPEALAAKAADVVQLRATASPFGKRRATYTIGAVYEAGGELDEAGRLVMLTRDQSYRAMLDTEAVAALTLLEKSKAAAEDVKKAEAKARKNGGPSLDSLLDQVARIVARSPLSQQQNVANGFAREVSRRAYEITRR